MNNCKERKGGVLVAPALNGCSVYAWLPAVQCVYWRTIGYGMSMYSNIRGCVIISVKECDGFLQLIRLQAR